MSGTVTDRSRSRVDPEEVAVLYIQRRGRKTKFQWGPVTKEEGGGGQEKEQELGQQKELGREKELDQEKGVERKKHAKEEGEASSQEVIGSCFLCPFLARHTASTARIREELYSHYALKHFRKDILSCLPSPRLPSTCPLCPPTCPAWPVGRLLRHLATFHSLVEGYLPSTFHIPVARHGARGQAAGGGLSREVVARVEASIDRAVLGGLESLEEAGKTGLKTAEDSPDSKKAEGRLLECVPGPAGASTTFSCCQCDFILELASRRQVVLHYTLHHYQDQVVICPMSYVQCPMSYMICPGVGWPHRHHLLPLCQEGRRGQAQVRTGVKLYCTLLYCTVL